VRWVTDDASDGIVQPKLVVGVDILRSLLFAVVDVKWKKDSSLAES
jgi:hypothetical protein